MKKEKKKYLDKSRKGAKPEGYKFSGVENRYYDSDVSEVLKEIERYRSETRKGFVSISEIILIMKNLGWKKC